MQKILRTFIPPAFFLFFCFLALTSRWGHTAPGEEASLSAANSFRELEAGNERFIAGKAEHPRQDAERRVSTARKGQAPIALVLACSDSRETVELLFDQGIGDIFVVRVAGNTTSAAVLGSIEYGVKHLHIPLVVVLGHTKCGAVDSVWQGDKVEGNLAELLAPIVPAVEEIKNENAPLEGKDEEALKRLAEARNVEKSVTAILADPGPAQLVKEGKLQVLGALYNLESGEISWLDLVRGASTPPRKGEFTFDVGEISWPDEHEKAALPRDGVNQAAPQ